MAAGEKPAFYEFFAGGGMVRAGLGAGWSCLFANDIDPRKAASYRANWAGDALRLGDVAGLEAAALPGRPDLVWASFPCQDLSLAGAGAGLGGGRSGAFWPFWALVRGLRAGGRAPRVVALENVCGALTSHGGRDFTALCAALAAGGYRFGALVIDAALFLPQSRPRLFLIALDASAPLPEGLAATGPSDPWHGAALRRAHAALPEALRADWIWWRLPAPPPRRDRLIDLIEPAPAGVAWRTPAEVQALLAMMGPATRAKLAAARAEAAGGPAVGAVYRRTRQVDGARVQRAEARFDGLAGCLRTPAGGSSRQSLLLIDGAGLRARLMSARETARLMGLPDAYVLPDAYSAAYHLTGDGVVVPVVGHLARHLLEPLVAATGARRAA